MATRKRASAGEGEGEGEGEGGAEWRNVINAQTGALMTQGETREEQEENIVDRVRDLLAINQGAEVKIKLYRVDPKSPRMTYCADYSPEEYEAGDLPMIREQWGPGEYEIRVITRKGIATKARVSIAAQLGAVAIAAHVPAQSAESSALAEIMRHMADTQARILEALSARPDPRADMLQNLEMMRAMREAMGISANPAPVAAPVSSLSQLTEMLAVMRELKSASQEFNPAAAEKDGDGNLMQLVGQGLEMVQTALSNKNAAPAQLEPMAIPPSIAGAVGRPQQQAIEGAQHDAQIPVGETQEESIQMMVLRGALEGLIELADKKAPHNEGAEYVLDTLPADLLPYLRLPNWLSILRKFAPFAAEGLTRNEEWLKTTRDEALRMMAEEGPDDV